MDSRFECSHDVEEQGMSKEAESNQRWEAEFNMRVSRISQGAILSDFPDDEIEAIYRMRDLGFTPEEAVDVCEEVRDVE